MMPRMVLSLALASVGLVLSVSCSQTASKKKEAKESELQAKKEQNTKGHYTTLIFHKGDTSLSEMNKKNLEELTKRADGDNRAIEEIKVLVWSDREYPEDESKKASTKDIILASERAVKIKDYLEDDLKTKDDIDSFNMAKRPNLVSQLFKSDDYEVKNAFEKTGATSTKLTDGTISYTKASKALVIIEYKE